MRSLTASILFASLTEVCLAAPAQEAPPAWVGVWQGTVGKAPVKLCLQHDYRVQGAYYYARYLRVISLEGDEKARPDPLAVALVEAMPVSAKAGKAGGTEPVAWTLRAGPDRRTLEGSWRSSTKTQPVQLTRLAELGPDERSCEADAFNLPLERPGSVAASDARLKGTAYRSLLLVVDQKPEVSLEAFELLRTDAGAARFNAAMRKLLRDEQEAMFGCLRGALGSFAAVGDYSMRVEPKAIGRRWLVAGEGGSNSCGGAHPNQHLGYQTWDLEAGRKVDPWTWFGPKGAVARVVGEGASRYTSVEIGAALRALLVKHWPRNDDGCGDVPESRDYWTPFPTAAGMGFLPQLAHAQMACSEDVLVPWTKIVPLLSDRGRRAVESLRADLATPPER